MSVVISEEKLLRVKIPQTMSVILITWLEKGVQKIKNNIRIMTKPTIIRCIKWILCIILIIYVSIILIDIGTNLCYIFKGTQWYPARIERITGIGVPHYKLINHYVSHLCIEEDSIVFYAVPSSDIFDEIDKRIATGDTCWERKENLYSFRLCWDNECSPPKGENYYEGYFYIRLTKGEKIGKIVFWDLERLHKKYHKDEKNN